MAFLTSEKKNAGNQLTQHQIDLIVKAHGFDPGTYEFVPNNGVPRKEGSIINGTVKGSFIIERKDNNNNPITFSRSMYPNEKQWRRICASFNFGFHQIDDIDEFIIYPDGAIEVVVSIVTPKEEV